MIIEELIFELLQTPAVSAIVGDRVYPNFVPRGVQRPCICFYQFSYREEESHDVEYGSSEAMHGFRFELHPPTDIHAENYLIGKNLAREVRNAFRGLNLQRPDLCISKILPADQEDDWLTEIEGHAVKSAYIFHELIQ